MNYNVISYLIYGCVSVYIIYWVGKLFHRNGRIFILRLFRNNESMTDTTNNLLLLAYYLFNIGYSILQFSFWERVTGIETMIASISMKTGILIMILAITHYFNISLIYLLSKRNYQSITSKNLKS
jgi:Glycerol-3-phosphate O-acyltransferase